MAVLEAMAMGRAIITTDVPGCRQTVRNGSNGFLVPAKDAPALAQAMERFVLDPDLPVAMGRQSRQIALEEYNVHEVNKVIIRNLGLVAG